MNNSWANMLSPNPTIKDSYLTEQKNNGYNTPATVPSDEYMLSKSLHSSIIVPLFENLFGGLGVIFMGFGIYLLYKIIQAIYHGTSTWLYAILLCLAGGLIIGGLFTAIHFFRDEWRIVMGLRNARVADQERQQLTGALKAAINKVKELEDKLAVTDRYSSLALAERLLREYFMHKKPMNRDTAMERGWIRGDWQQAFNHMKNARVIDAKGLLLVDSYELAMAKALTATTGDGRYVRSKDGDFVRVGAGIELEKENNEAVDEPIFPKAVARNPASKGNKGNIEDYNTQLAVQSGNKRYTSRKELREVLSN